VVWRTEFARFCPQSRRAKPVSSGLLRGCHHVKVIVRQVPRGLPAVDERTSGEQTRTLGLTASTKPSLFRSPKERRVCRHQVHSVSPVCSRAPKAPVVIPVGQQSVGSVCKRGVDFLERLSSTCLAPQKEVLLPIVFVFGCPKVSRPNPPSRKSTSWTTTCQSGLQAAGSLNEAFTIKNFFFMEQPPDRFGREECGHNHVGETAHHCSIVLKRLFPCPEKAGAPHLKNIRRAQGFPSRVSVKTPLHYWKKKDTAACLHWPT